MLWCFGGLVLWQFGSGVVPNQHPSRPCHLDLSRRRGTRRCFAQGSELSRLELLRRQKARELQKRLPGPPKSRPAVGCAASYHPKGGFSATQCDVFFDLSGLFRVWGLPLTKSGTISRGSEDSLVTYQNRLVHVTRKNPAQKFAR